MRLVLDTNVIVSALLSPDGPPAKILNLVLNGTATLLYDNSILSEYSLVLTRKKFNINKELVGIIMDFIGKEGEYEIAVPQKIKFADNDDKKFYELYKTGADYLVTGNKKHFPGEKGIVTPREFLEKEF